MASGGREPPGVRVWRGAEIESLHHVHAAVARADGKTVATCGDPSVRVFLRSAAKPVQALPLVEEGLAERYGLAGEELAVIVASHNGEPHHLAVVERILAKAGLEPAHLQCGADLPLHAPTAHALLRAGGEPTPLHNNCSGKHAGMLAVCRGMGWSLETYREPEHPLQRRIERRIAELSGENPVSIGRAIDGCGVPTHALPLRAVARLFAGLAAADASRADDRERAVGVVLDAMSTHPVLVAGAGRLCTDVMAVAGARVVVKTGAEGVYGAALRGRGEGLALKVADGAWRAQDVALVTLLAALGIVAPAEDATLVQWLRPEVRNHAGTVVGWIDAHVPLERPA